MRRSRPNVELLIAARALQGVGGALLTPGSLAIISGVVPRRTTAAAAIGAWSGLGGVAGAVGPFLGGWLVDASSWRLVFLINLPLAALVRRRSPLRHVPETRDPDGGAGGSTSPAPSLGALGLAGLTCALTEAGGRGWTAACVARRRGRRARRWRRVRRGRAAAAAPDGAAAASSRPRQFTAANVVTLLVYGGARRRLLPRSSLQLQVVAGFSPLAAGAALLPAHRC